jgi:hypothetical protein
MASLLQVTDKSEKSGPQQRLVKTGSDPRSMARISAAATCHEGFRIDFRARRPYGRRSKFGGTGRGALTSPAGPPPV